VASLTPAPVEPEEEEDEENKSNKENAEQVSEVQHSFHKHSISADFVVNLEIFLLCFKKKRHPQRQTKEPQNQPTKTKPKLIQLRNEW